MKKVFLSIDGDSRKAAETLCAVKGVVAASASDHQSVTAFCGDKFHSVSLVEALQADNREARIIAERRYQ